MKENFYYIIIISVISKALLERNGPFNLPVQQRGRSASGKSHINQKLASLRYLGRKVFVKNGIVDQVAVEQLIRAFSQKNIVDQIIVAQLIDGGALINEKNANLVCSLIAECKEKYLDNLLSATPKDQKPQLEKLSKTPVQP